MIFPTPNTGEAREAFRKRALPDVYLVRAFPRDDHRDQVVEAIWTNNRGGKRGGRNVADICGHPGGEVRAYDAKLELRKEEGNKDFIVGHAAVFNKRSLLLFGYFFEYIARNSFTKSIEEDDIRALFNHEPNLVLGRNRSGTLLLEEDDVGLRMKIRLPDTTLGKDLRVSVDRGDITQASFGFDTIEDEWDKDSDGVWVRTLRKARLWDVSPVTFPAFTDTDVALRSFCESKHMVQKPPEAVTEKSLTIEEARARIKK